MWARAPRSCRSYQRPLLDSINRPRRGCLLEPEPPLIVLLHPKIGNMLIPRRHYGSVAFIHVNDAIVSDNRGLIVNRQNSQIVSVEIFQLTVASALGITVAELFGIKTEAHSKRRKQSVKIKYRDPAEPDNTWTGKGRPPKWMQEKLDAGAQKEDFQV